MILLVLSKSLVSSSLPAFSSGSDQIHQFSDNLGQVLPLFSSSMLFPGNDPVGAVTDSVGVSNAQTSETDANEVLPTLEGRYHRQGELLLQLLILLKEYHQHLVLIMCKWRFKFLQST